MPEKLYLLGGNGSQKNWFEDVIPLFSDCSVEPIELPGFGSNFSSEFHTLDELATALIKITEDNSHVFAVGVTSLIVLRSCILNPHHFKKITLLAPVGAYLWQRKFAIIMKFTIVQKGIKFLLGHFPKLYAKKFSYYKWNRRTITKIGEGYRNCRAFGSLFTIVEPNYVLNHMEWITEDISIIWGKKDRILNIDQLPAWDSILPRANLEIVIKDNWGHYPYFDDPNEFVNYFEQPQTIIKSHTKGGRLHLASLVNLNVPRLITISRQNANQQGNYKELNSIDTKSVYAVRSSSFTEDQIDSSNAGVNTTYLRVEADDLSLKVQSLFRDGIDEVVVQKFIEPGLSGVAFLRNIAFEIEWVEGHLSKLVDGIVTPNILILTKMPNDWKIDGSQIKLEKNGLKINLLESFFNQILHTFHYLHVDVEWGWDGKELHLFQVRPVTAYQWRRAITSANLDEILPKQVSMIMEYAQVRASNSIPKVNGIWDKNVHKDNEPFTVLYNESSYINLDMILGPFRIYGLPSKLVSRQMGGSVPNMKFRIFPFVISIPIFLKMVFRSRKLIFHIELELHKHWLNLNSQLKEKSTLSKKEFETRLVNWFVRYYTFIVQSNIIINTMITTCGGSWLTKIKTVYSEDHNLTNHRVKFESDVASIRTGKLINHQLSNFPTFNILQQGWHRLGLPGLGGLYFAIREWFRDNNMKLFFIIHNELKSSNWLKLIEPKRERSGTFWQSGMDIGKQDHGFLIYPGRVTGIVGSDIIVVDALDPGHIEDYIAAKAVISKSGGRLSHGATLLREKRIPSAIIPDISVEMDQKITFNNGKISV